MFKKIMYKYEALKIQIYISKNKGKYRFSLRS